MFVVDCPVEYNQRVSDVSEVEGQWRLTTESGHTRSCDALILTIPVPQILELTGTIKSVIGKMKHTLSPEAILL